MITTVAIQGFQSIAKAQLFFGNFNCIVGSSDSGKSAFMRAVLAIVEARRGHDFITVGKDNANVLISFADGVTAAWRKTKTTGKYVLQKADGTKLEFTKYGASCPAEVTEVLQLGRVVIDDQVSFNPNFITQFDPLFLITERGSAAARILSTVTNANNLLLAVREANTRATRSQGELTIYERDLAELDRQAEQFDGLDDEGERLLVIGERIGAHLRQRVEAQKLVTTQGVISHKIDEIRRLRSDIVVLKHLLDLYERANVCLATAESLAELSKLYDSAIRSVRRLTKVQSEVERLRVSTQVLNKLDTLQNDFAALEQLKRTAAVLTLKQRVCVSVKTQVGEKLSELDNVNAALKEFTSCPLCDRPFTECNHELERVS